MWPLARRCHRLLLLPTLLWTAAWSGTSQVQSADTGASDEVLKLIVDNITSKFGPLISQLVSRVDGMDSHLNTLSSRLDDLARRTDSLLPPPPRDCSGLPAGSRSGIYQLRLHPFQPPVPAYCDMETDGGGWTVIQRRRDIEPRLDFDRNWNDYEVGFGDLHGELWFGLQNMWKLTRAKERQYELRVNLADFEGERRYATYSRFRVGPETDGYRLTVSGYDYSSTAGDSFGLHSGVIFSTKDRDQDDWPEINCAEAMKGGWWLGPGCYIAFLNGPCQSCEQGGGLRPDWDRVGGIHWYHFKGEYLNYSLKEAEMKIRPV